MINAEVEENKEQDPKKKSVLKEIMDWVISIGAAVIAVALINMFVFVQVMVDGVSMNPTLQDEDRLFAVRFLYEPKQGDIVVLEPFLDEGSVKGKLMFGRTLYIKRVIAVGGQTIDVKNDKVYIDGNELKEDYIQPDAVTRPISLELPVTVPEGCVFVMGDNRMHSRDSRDQTIGIIRNEQLVGRAVFRIFPFGDMGAVK